MTTQIQEILIIDEDEELRTLLEGELMKSGFVVQGEASAGAALDWLENHQPLLMLLDHDLPDLTGRDFLNTLDERGRRIPFVVISGKEDVRTAVDLMKGGALDFILKDAVLPGVVGPMVERCVKGLEVRRELEEAQGRLTRISEVISDVFWMMDAHGNRMLYVSPAYEKIWGKSVESLYEDGESWRDSIVEEDRSKVLRSFERLANGSEGGFDEVYRIRNPQGELRWIRDRGFASYDEEGKIGSLTGVAADITANKALEHQAIEAAERERMRIGRDLHDDLCQRLAALKLRCGILQEHLASSGSEEAKEMEDVAKGIGEAATLSRRIARGLAPVGLEAEGLMFALEELAETIEGRYGLPCRFDCPKHIEVGDPTCAAHVFRIAQELLNNAAKHAKPTHLLLGLYPGLGGFQLEVVNDGEPFHGPSKERLGMGLHFLRFRVDAIGASLDFYPGKMPDGGCRVVCLVPGSEKEEKGSRKIE